MAEKVNAGVLEALKPLPKPADRTKAALLGCFVGDAATMPLHWIYDNEKLRSAFGDADPLFFGTHSAPFYSSTDFPGHYELGMLSPYGEQALAALEITRKLSTPGAVLDGDAYAAEWHQWALADKGREDHMLKGFKETMAGGAKYPTTGVDDNQAQSFGKLATVMSVYEGSDQMLASMEVAVRALQNNDLNCDVSRFNARMLQSVINGQSIRSAFDAAKAAMPAEGEEDLKKAIARLEANLARDPHEWLMEYGKEVKPEFPAAALACPNPQAFMGSMHIILTATSFEDGIRANLLIGGDNCSRATLVGSILGAAFGVPHKLAEKLNAGVLGAMVPSMPASKRAAAALLGCFVGDAATMPVHWIYDNEKLKGILGDAEPLFFGTHSVPFYSATEFPGHYELGMLSPYGEQALSALQIARKLVSRGTYGEANAPLDGESFATEYHQWVLSYTGREDGMLKAFKENIAGGGKYPVSGVDDDQAQSFGKLATVMSVYEGSDHFVSSVDVAVRALQNNELNLQITQFMARMLEAIVAGKSIRSAYDAAKAAVPTEGHEELLKAVACVEANLATNPHDMLMEKGQEADPSWPQKGLACHNPMAFMGALHVILNASSFEDGLEANLRIGGDNCSRSTLVGTILGAAFGVPHKLAEKLSLEVRAQM